MALFFNGQCCLANSKILFQPNYLFDGGMKAMKIKLNGNSWFPQVT